jgi:hypothetical protein
MLRFSAFCLSAVLLFTLTVAQDGALSQGSIYPKTIKGLEGDLQLVTNGTADASGKPVLIVMEGSAYKAVRLDASLKPMEELSLTGQTFDAVKWDAVTSLLDDRGMHVLFVSNGKKNADYAMGRVNMDGALAITDFQKITSFPETNVFDPQTTTCKKTLPDLILFDNGAAYDQRERLVRSTDGTHFLLNHYTHKQKGPKKFWFAYLDRDFKMEWSGAVDLPFADSQSDVHQITLDDRGRIHLLVYVLACADPERAGDKLCHETHIVVLSEKGTRIKDLLLDKDFVASARLLPKPNGQLQVALRYGALTGLPGQFLTIDTAITKLKATPLVDQRVTAIRKTKLSVFGAPSMDAVKKPGTSRAVKVPDEIIDLIPAWTGGTLLLEGFRDAAMEIPVGNAVALRTLHGAVRATYFDAKDSIRWQQVVDRAFMTTAGEAYGSIAYQLSEEGILLVYNHSPGGLAAINSTYGEEDVKKKKDQPATVEPSELRSAWLSADGKPAVEHTLGKPEKGFTLCPMTLAMGAAGNAWIKGYDRATQHSFVRFDPQTVRK